MCEIRFHDVIGQSTLHMFTSDKCEQSLLDLESFLLSSEIYFYHVTTLVSDVI